MSEKKHFILTAIDRSPWVVAVVDYAAWVAKSLATPIKFLHTIDHANLPAPIDITGSIGLGARSESLYDLTKLEQERSRLLIKKGQFMIEAAKAQATKLGVTDQLSNQRHGALSEALIELEEQIQVLVIGANGEQSDGAKLETLIRALHKPILVVNGQFKEPKKLMLAYNGDDASNKALAMISNSKLSKGLECHVVFVGDETDEVKQLLSQAKRSLEANDMTVTTKCLHGKAEDALTAYRAANKLDITIMGAFGHHKLRNFLLGSFTANMLEATKKPLLLLR